MNEFVQTVALEASGARRITQTDAIQSLWSGYGQIVRCHLEGALPDRVIVKHVRWPTKSQHPRGWNSSASHRRKVRSYEVESTWYRRYAAECSDRCRVPRCLDVQTRGDEVCLVLEDLDAAGFPERRSQVTAAELDACLRWLAEFHARFIGRSADGLWPTGTYWHLDTRPDELAALPEGDLKQAAETIDQRLNATPFMTLVHGDAKLANFCFNADGTDVAAVDFQYVGGGCGIKDVAYFISSCLDESQAERHEQRLLDAYFDHLGRALRDRNADVDFAAVHDSWRELYAVAWTDFFRFLQGWSPGHWKIHRYSERLAREVLAAL